MSRALSIIAMASLCAGCVATKGVVVVSGSAGAANGRSEIRGEAFAQRACAGCHAIGRSGASRASHAPTFRNLAQTRSDADIRRVLSDIPRYGHVEMPPVYITGDELKDVAAYIISLRGRVT